MNCLHLWHHLTCSHINILLFPFDFTTASPPGLTTSDKRSSSMWRKCFTTASRVKWNSTDLGGLFISIRTRSLRESHRPLLVFSTSSTTRQAWQVAAPGVRPPSKPWSTSAVPSMLLSWVAKMRSRVPLSSHSSTPSAHSLVPSLFPSRRWQPSRVVLRKPSRLSRNSVSVPRGPMMALLDSNI